MYFMIGVNSLFIEFDIGNLVLLKKKSNNNNNNDNDNNNNNNNNNNSNNNNNKNCSRKRCSVVKEGLIKFIIFSKI